MGAVIFLFECSAGRLIFLNVLGNLKIFDPAIYLQRNQDNTLGKSSVNNNENLEFALKTA